MKQKPTKIFVSILIVTTLLTFVSIFVTANALESNPQTFTGVVQYQDLEGGFYSIDRYILSGGDKFNFEAYVGKNVVISGIVDKDVVSFFMWGDGFLRVNSIEELKSPENPKDPNLVTPDNGIATLDTNTLNPNPLPSPEYKPKIKKFIGVVRYNNLEGGFYYIGKYVLRGTIDLKPYVGKRVVMTGILTKSNVPIYNSKNGFIDVSTIRKLKKFAGVVKYNNLEGGYYYIGKYILKGKVDFNPYVGKRVVVSGYLSKPNVSIHPSSKGSLNVVSIK